MKILWSQEKKLASQDNFLAFFFLENHFFLVFSCCFANKLGEFFLALLGRFVFRANNGKLLGGHPEITSSPVGEGGAER